MKRMSKTLTSPANLDSLCINSEVLKELTSWHWKLLSPFNSQQATVGHFICCLCPCMSESRAVWSHSSHVSWSGEARSPTCTGVRACRTNMFSKEFLRVDQVLLCSCQNWGHAKITARQRLNCTLALVSTTVNLSIPPSPDSHHQPQSVFCSPAGWSFTFMTNTINEMRSAIWCTVQLESHSALLDMRVTAVSCAGYRRKVQFSNILSGILCSRQLQL